MHEVHHSKSETSDRLPQEGAALGFFLFVFFRRREAFTLLDDPLCFLREFFHGFLVHTHRYIPEPS